MRFRTRKQNKPINEAHYDSEYTLHVFLDSPYKWGKGWTGSSTEKEEAKLTYEAILIRLNIEPERSKYGVVESKIGDGDQISGTYMHDMQLTFYLNSNEQTLIDKIINVVNIEIDTLENFTITSIKISDKQKKYTVIKENLQSTDNVNVVISKYFNNINTVSDVKNFFNDLKTKFSLSFHPDDTFQDYVNIDTKEEYFDINQAELLDLIMDDCFAVCEKENVDIYEIGLNVLQNESLSSERTDKIRLDILIKTAQEMIEAKMKAQELKELRKEKSAEVEKILDELNTNSIIANNILVEVIKPYQRHNLDTKEYQSFVENSVDKITKEYTEMHNKAIEFAKYTVGGSSYFMQHKNSKGFDHGTIVKENLSNKFRSFIRALYLRTLSLFSRFKRTINNIENELIQFNLQFNENYTGRKSKYIDLIIEILTQKSDLKYTEIAEKGNIELGTGPDLSLFQNIHKLLKHDIIKREKKSGSKAYYYSLVNRTDEINIEDADITDVSEIEPDNDPIISALESVKEFISITEEEKYYEELATIKQQEVIRMLKEFSGKKLVIEDKVLTLVERQDSERIDWTKYQEFMTNCEQVSNTVAEMSKDLFSLHSKVVDVSSSVRQYKDDKNLPEGTLGATFDYVMKTVVPPIVKENFMSNLINKAKRFIKNIFSRFNMRSQKVNRLLDSI